MKYSQLYLIFIVLFYCVGLFITDPVLRLINLLMLATAFTFGMLAMWTERSINKIEFKIKKMDATNEYRKLSLLVHILKELKKMNKGRKRK